jgi:hypothetical protein
VARHPFAACVATVIVITGCSGGGSPRPSSNSAAATSVPAVASTAAPVSAAPSSSVNLTATDFPAGWTVTPAPPATSGSDPAATALLTCLHLDPAARKVVTEVPSAVFSLGQTVQASSDVTTLSSPTTAGQEVAALRAPGGLTCLGQVIGQAVAAQGIGVTGATIKALAAAPTGTYPSVAVTYQATLTQQEQSLQAATDEYLIARGNQEVTITFSGYGAPFPTAVEAAAMAKLTARL